MSKVSVVIPNWNGAHLIEPCLAALKRQTNPADQVIVVDNGSSDGSVKLLEQKHPDVEIVSLERNYGFAGGVNCGIERALEAGATHIALLNNDAEPEPQWLDELLKVMNTQDDVAAGAGKQVDYNGKIDTTGEVYSVWGTPFSRGRGEADKGQYDEQTDIFAATGGASLYSAAAIRSIGLMDERFFAYYEDVDWSFRARLAGWKIRYTPSAVVQHQVGSTSEKLGAFRQQHMLKNTALLYTKNMPALLYWRHLPKLAVTISVKSLNLLMHLHILPLLKAWAGIICYTPAALAERRHIQKDRQLSADQVAELLYKDLSPSQRKKPLLKLFNKTNQ